MKFICRTLSVIVRRLGEPDEPKFSAISLFMKIVIVTPAAARSRNGNRTTAQRWARFLRQLGHRVKVEVDWDGAPADVMIALHARRSHASIKRFAAAHPDRPLVVALTGTDLYRDIQTDAGARESMQWATRMIVLQDKGLDELPLPLRAKTRVIYQSAEEIAARASLKRYFEVCVIGHLREEKDPFRCALASGLLPTASRIRVSHVGRALEEDMARRANELMQRFPRYRWLGEIPHWQVRRKLAHSHLLVISSRMEGGANVVCEALAAGVPVLASRVAGNVGMLGEDYAGYYPVGDEQALARLLWRTESDVAFRSRLQVQCAARRARVRPEQERIGLARLLAELEKPPSDRRFSTARG